MDINPVGNLLFVKNEDIPGVIGKVGSLLGKNNINIGAYILSSASEMDEAFAVIRLDTKASSSNVEALPVQEPSLPSKSSLRNKLRASLSWSARILYSP